MTKCQFKTPTAMPWNWRFLALKVFKLLSESGQNSFFLNYKLNPTCFTTFPNNKTKFISFKWVNRLKCCWDFFYFDLNNLRFQLRFFYSTENFPHYFTPDWYFILFWDRKKYCVMCLSTFVNWYVQFSVDLYIFKFHKISRTWGNFYKTIFCQVTWKVYNFYFT